MFTVTINCNTLEELFDDLKTLLSARPGIAAPVPASFPAPPAITPAAAEPAAPPVIPIAPPAVTAAIAPAVAPVVPTGAPVYTLDQLARAGAVLAQAGKMESALALLAKYGIQSVSQLKPEQYGAFATELRALGAQL
jgi:hypothetical protein